MLTTQITYTKGEIVVSIISFRDDQIIRTYVVCLQPEGPYLKNRVRQLCEDTSHSPRFALAIHFSELVAINILFNAGAYL